MLVIIAFLMILFMVILAFSVDIAIIQMARTELRTATDAAANAAAVTLADTGSQENAITVGTRIARSNAVLNQPLELAPGDFEFGRSTQQPSGKFSFSDAVSPSNTVRVTGQRTRGSRSGAIPLLFAQALGARDFETSLRATASFSHRDIVLVIDRSGSMAAAGRWPALLSAVDEFVLTLDGSLAEERVGLASYSTFASRDVELTDDLSEVIDGASTIRLGGWTAIGRGINAGRQILESGSRVGYTQRTMIVMTDGRHNRGTAPEIEARLAAERGITVHTITFSRGADQRRMREVAREGGGNHYHATTAEQLRAIYREIALALRTVMTE